MTTTERPTLDWLKAHRDELEAAAAQRDELAIDVPSMWTAYRNVQEIERTWRKRLAERLLAYQEAKLK